MYHTYNKATFESTSRLNTISKDDILLYIKSLINKSMFSEAIDYIGKIKLPAIAYADEFNLAVMEQFIKLLVYQGYHLKAETIIEKAKNRALDLYLMKNEDQELLNLYIKFNIWESTIKQALKKSYPSIPIFESLDNYFESISDDLVKAQVYLQASHLHEFIGSQESFLKESFRLVSGTPKSQNQAFLEVQIMNALGVFYGLIGEVNTCKDILEDCITKATDLGDRRRVAGSMLNLANLYYFDMENSPETQLIGRSMIQESIKISEEIECVEYATIGNLLLAEYYFKRGKSSQSLPYYEKVYELQTKRGIISNQEKIDELLSKTQDQNDTYNLGDSQEINETDKISR